MRNDLGHHAVHDEQVEPVLEVVPEAGVGLRVPAIPLRSPNAIEAVVLFPVFAQRCAQVKEQVLRCRFLEHNLNVVREGQGGAAPRLVGLARDA